MGRRRRGEGGAWRARTRRTHARGGEMTNAGTSLRHPMMHKHSYWSCLTPTQHACSNLHLPLRLRCCLVWRARNIILAVACVG